MPDSEAFNRGPVFNRGAELLLEWRGDRQAKDVCELLGLDQASYSRFEHGVRKPSGEVAFRIEGVTRGVVPASSWYEAAQAAKAIRRRAAAS